MFTGKSMLLIYSNILIYIIALSALYGIYKNVKNVASWAIILGLLYYHPLFLNFYDYTETKILYSLFYLPLSIYTLQNSSIIMKMNDNNLNSYINVLTIILILSIVMIEVEVGLYNYFLTKISAGQIHDNFTIFSIIYYSSGTILAILFILKNNYRFYLLVILIVLMYILTGDRTQPAFIIVFWIISYITKIDKIGFKVIIISIISLIGITYGKQLYIYLITGSLKAFENYHGIGFEGLSESVSLIQAIEQGILMNVNIKLYLHNFWMYLSPISLGDDLHYFSHFYKKLLFPEYSENSGVAGNFLLEIYWNYSYYGLFIFGMLNVIILKTLQRISKMKQNHSILIALMIIVFYLYFPRNSLFTIISHEKKFLYTYILATIIIYMLRNIRRIYVTNNNSPKL
jgi:hypothetical protein